LVSRFVGFLFILIVIAQFPVVQELLIWDRTAIESGQWWRILTGNITHTNVTHMLMNLVALWVLALLHKDYYQDNTLTLLTLFMMPVIGLLMFFTPYSSYAGLSGVLHGLFAFGIIRDIQYQQPLGYLLFVLFFGKLIGELWTLGGSFNASLIEANVAYQAHWAGALIGLFAALLIEKPPLLKSVKSIS
jgi:rhomboid family GlyGly-CTERM serine protease